jgi:hypothetical protein
MSLKTITDQLRDWTHDELVSLANWCQSESRQRDPAVIAEQKRQAAFWVERDKLAKEKEAHNEKVEASLRKLLKPGMRLKMKGCKDGRGLREFIRWDGSNLVCWQILRHRAWDSKTWREEKTNQVTTHMPDKVQELYIDGTAMKVRSILK